MMRTGILLLALFGTSSASIAAQQRPIGAIAGEYHLDTLASSSVSTEIERALEGSSRLMKPFARGRLRRAHRPARSLAVRAEGQELTIVYGTRWETTLRPDGVPTPWVREDGEEFMVSAAWRGDTLVQRFEGIEEKRIIRYTRAEDGSLLLDVHARAPRVSRPLRYRLVYRPLPGT